MPFADDPGAGEDDYKWLFCDISIWLTNTLPALTHTSIKLFGPWLTGLFGQERKTWKPHLPVYRHVFFGGCFPEGDTELIWWLKWECFVLLIWDPPSTPLFLFYHNSFGIMSLSALQPPTNGSQSYVCLGWLWWWWLPLHESPVEIAGAKWCLPFIAPSSPFSSSAGETDDSRLFFPPSGCLW